MSDEIEMISPEAAAAILESELQRLEVDGWKVLVQTDYWARLTRGERNLDVRVDLLGRIEMEEKPLSPTQESGRMIAIVLLLTLFLVILTLVSSLGWLN